jgi:AcrR family transcriptional regulator
MSLKAVSRTPRMSSEDRRAQIVETACKLFSEKGYRGTTTRELAAAVGVTEPVLYEHFRTKGDLYTAIIESAGCRGLEELNALEARFREAEDDGAFFQELAQGILDFYVRDEAFIRLLLFSSLENHELKDLFHERSHQCFDIVSGYIRRRQLAGRIRPDIDAAVAARGFFGMIAHYALSAVVFKSAPLPFEPVEAVRRMVDIYLTGLCVQGKSEETR